MLRFIIYLFVSVVRNTLSSRTTQIKEDLNRLICLVPYGIVSYEVWAMYIDSLVVIDIYA